ncbi:MAG: histone deacetylase 11 [Mariniblastus sp.]|jgi:histone deacetylase 11
MSRIVYSKNYNIGFFGLERLHPFDSRKYGRAWNCLRDHFGAGLKAMHVRPRRPASSDELRLVHTDDYLAQLKSSHYVARAIEVPPAGRLPGWLVDRQVLKPMRWAVRGTILAAELALTQGLAVNLSGGYHHAKPTQGEGFCIYSDIGIAVASLRKQKLISEDARVAYIDTDAHQGNGVCHTFMEDDRVFIFDVFNCQIYPILDVKARRRVDCEIGISTETTDTEYMAELKGRVPGFLESICKSSVGLAIYNAGTDILMGDPVGNLNLSAATILQRDLYVVQQLRARGIPTVMVLSGGYTKQSYRLVADSVIALLERNHSY